MINLLSMFGNPMEAGILLFAALASLLIYFLPTIFAWKRQQNLVIVFCFNLLLGWTVLGYGVALYFALRPEKAIS